MQDFFSEAETAPYGCRKAFCAFLLSRERLQLLPLGRYRGVNSIAFATIGYFLGRRLDLLSHRFHRNSSKCRSQGRMIRNAVKRHASEPPDTDPIRPALYVDSIIALARDKY